MEQDTLGLIVFALVCLAALSTVFIRLDARRIDGVVMLGQLVMLLGSKFTFQHKAIAMTSFKYVLEALRFVKRLNTALSPESKKAVIFDETRKLCGEMGISLDPEVIQILTEVTDYAFELWGKEAMENSGNGGNTP
jgi:hypothetical protein